MSPRLPPRSADALTQIPLHRVTYAKKNVGMSYVVVPKTVATNPAVVPHVAAVQTAFGLYVPPVTTMLKKPPMRPVTPGATRPPLFAPDWQAPGLAPPIVTKLPLVKSSRTRYVPVAVGVVLT